MPLLMAPVPRTGISGNPIQVTQVSIHHLTTETVLFITQRERDGRSYLCTKLSDTHFRAFSHARTTSTMHSNCPQTHPCTTNIHPYTTNTHPCTTNTHPCTTNIHPCTTNTHPCTTNTHPCTTNRYPRTMNTYRCKQVTCLSRVSILTRDTDIANLSVCPSVCYVLVSDENGLTYRHSFFTIR